MPLSARFRATARIRWSFGRRGEGLGQARSVDVVELDADRPAAFGDRDGLGQRTVGDPQPFQTPERLPGGPTQLGMEAFGLELREDHEWDDHIVLLELPQCRRIRQQHRRVEDEGALIDAADRSPRAPTNWRMGATLR